MKKSLFLLPIMALIATGCANNDPEVADNTENQRPFIEGNGKYLTLNVVQAGKTRADEEYRDGDENENNINSVRFYFFNEAGMPSEVRINPSDESEYLSYIDWNPETGNDITDRIPSTPTDPGAETVEKIVSVSMMISGPEGSEAPALVVAVLNPTSKLTDLKGKAGNLSLQELSFNENLNVGIQDFWTGLHDNNFVMSNSVYGYDEDNDGNLERINYTLITEDNLQDSVNESANYPVVIYVERVLARLDLSVTAPSTGGLYPTGSKNMGKDVYVKILGWKLTSTAKTSRLVKYINSSWPSDLFGSEENHWNRSAYHRCFWAINPQVMDYAHYSYNEIKDNGEEFPETQTPQKQNYSRAYMQENAGEWEIGEEDLGNGPAHPTQVILAGELCDASGNTMPIYEYLQDQYASEDDLLTYFANNSNLYFGDSNNKEKMGAEDLKFISAPEYTGKTGMAIDGEYTVYAVLSEKGQAKTWYEGSAQNAQAFSTTDAVNNYLDLHYSFSKGTTMIWENGMTYFFFNIRHLGDEGQIGYYGVVRNHIYDAVINKIEGLGTPVYDPDLVIYPEYNERTKGLLAVQIRILQWRVVTYGYELSW